MRIYCFEIEDNLEWPTGTAVPAHDHRTSATVLLYRSLDPELPVESANSINRRRQARAILDTLPLPRPASSQAFHPTLELLSCNNFIALAAPDAAAARPALDKLRAQGLFQETQKPPPPPSPPTVCIRCRQSRLLVNGVCATCAHTQKTPRPKAPRKPRNSRVWFIRLVVVMGLLVGSLSLWWSQPDKPTSPAKASVVQFATSQKTVRKGARVMLSWNTSGLSSLSISPGIGPVAASGKRFVVINHDTTFTLLATGPGYTNPVTVTVSVTKQAFLPKPSSINPVQSATPQP